MSSGRPGSDNESVGTYAYSGINSVFGPDAESMSATAVKNIDLFDQIYRDRVRNAVWAAIIGSTRDSASGVVALRNYEIYDALLQVQATILASSKQAESPTKTREIANEFAKRLIRHVAEFKKAYERDGMPFDVLHTDELQ